MTKLGCKYEILFANPIPQQNFTSLTKVKSIKNKLIRKNFVTKLVIV